MVANTLLSTLDEPIFVLTCDNVTDIDFAELAADYEALGKPANLIVPVDPIEGLDGDYIFHEGPVVTALERGREAPTYASGIQILNPAKVAQMTDRAEDFSQIWQRLIAQKAIYVSSVKPKRWFSCDTIEHLNDAMARSGWS